MEQLYETKENVRNKEQVIFVKEFHDAVNCDF